MRFIALLNEEPLRGAISLRRGWVHALRALKIIVRRNIRPEGLIVGHLLNSRILIIPNNVGGFVFVDVNDPGAVYWIRL